MPWRGISPEGDGCGRPDVSDTRRGVVRSLLRWISRARLAPAATTNRGTLTALRGAGCRLLREPTVHRAPAAGLLLRPVAAGWQIALTPFGQDHSVISELSSWRRRQPSGLFKCRVTLQKSRASDGCQVIDIVIKAKPSDRDALDVGETVAGICDTRLADAFHTYRPRDRSHRQSSTRDRHL